MFKRKQKKLTLRQIHELYLLLKYTLPEKEEEYLIDEFDKILEKMTEITMDKSLELLGIDAKGKNGIQVLILFIKRLREIGFFDYAKFLQGLKRA